MIAAGLMVVPWWLQRRRAYLRRHGQAIVTTFREVSRDTRFVVGGEYPFVVVSVWRDPHTGVEHVFSSEYLWADPSAFLQNQPITVYRIPAKPERYYVDLSFLLSCQERPPASD